MTIEKDLPWGGPGTLPAGAPVASGDAEAARLVAGARGTGETNPVVGILAGDLCRTVGGPGSEERLRSADAVALPMDLAVADLDGRFVPFVAHLIVRGPWWRGTLVAVMNAQWVGTADVAPRSHPNDGLLDVFDATSMTFDDRLKAKKRLRTGTHVPHPAIAQRRSAEVELAFEKATRVWVDGRAAGRVRNLSVHLLADAWTAII